MDAPGRDGWRTDERDSTGMDAHADDPPRFRVEIEAIAAELTLLRADHLREQAELQRRLEAAQHEAAAPLVARLESIERALTEGWSMTLEGVHLVPGLVPAHIDGALVVHAVLAIEDEDVHRTHFHVRDAKTGGIRAMDRYLSQLDAIRRVQDYIVSCAQAAGVPVIEGSNPGRATAALLELYRQSDVEQLLHTFTQRVGRPHWTSPSRAARIICRLAGAGQRSVRAVQTIAA